MEDSERAAIKRFLRENPELKREYFIFSVFAAFKVLFTSPGLMISLGFFSICMARGFEARGMVMIAVPLVWIGLILMVLGIFRLIICFPGK